MDDKTSKKPEDSKPEANKGQAPKADNADNDVVNAKGGDKDGGSKKVADGAGAPKDSQKGSEKAAATHDLFTFLHLSSLAEDQTFAFKVWAEAEDLGKLSLESWQKRLQDFLARPV